MRPVTAEGFVLLKGPAPDVGLKPAMKWIPLGDLVVDEAYQRPIYGAGRTNVRKIAENFKWSCFAPLIVAPIKGDKFAIIDGQHRATAACLVGIASVPCQVVDASQREQARAFQAINGMTTKMSRQAVHAAAVAAGDPVAKELEAICATANVEILRYPIAANLQTKPGQTMAVGCLLECLKIFGRETLITALQCVTETENNNPGVLVATVIRAITELLWRRKDWREAGSKLLEVFDHVDVGHEMDRIYGVPRPKGTSQAQMLSARLEGLVADEWKSRSKAKPLRHGGRAL